LFEQRREPPPPPLARIARPPLQESAFVTALVSAVCRLLLDCVQKVPPPRLRCELMRLMSPMQTRPLAPPGLEVGELLRGQQQGIDFLRNQQQQGIVRYLEMAHLEWSCVSLKLVPASSSPRMFSTSYVCAGLQYDSSAGRRIQVSTSSPVEYCTAIYCRVNSRDLFRSSGVKRQG